MTPPTYYEIMWGSQIRNGIRLTRCGECASIVDYHDIEQHNLWHENQELMRESLIGMVTRELLAKMVEGRA
jgi:hypothetical protein